jgi:hypothetical protein
MWPNFILCSSYRLVPKINDIFPKFSQFGRIRPGASNRESRSSYSSASYHPVSALFAMFVFLFFVLYLVFSINTESHRTSQVHRYGNSSTIGGTAGVT